MIIEEAITAHLTTTAGLAALIGTRVSPLRLPENPTYPVVTYQRISAPRIQSHTGPSGLAYPRFQFDCYATTYLRAKHVAEQVRLALDGYVGTMGGAAGVPVSSSLIQSDRDDYDPTTRIWRISLDFIIGHQE